MSRKLEIQEDLYQDCTKILCSRLYLRYILNILSKFGNLNVSYTSYLFSIWLFVYTEDIPKGLWDDMKPQREFLDWIGSQLGVQKAEDWYSIKAVQVHSKGGAGLLARYGNSLSKGMYRDYCDWC
jgi:hypothetical protein